MYSPMTLKELLITLERFFIDLELFYLYLSMSFDILLKSSCLVYTYCLTESKTNFATIS